MNCIVTKLYEVTSDGDCVFKPWYRNTWSIPAGVLPTDPSASIISPSVWLYHRSIRVLKVERGA